MNAGRELDALVAKKVMGFADVRGEYIGNPDGNMPKLPHYSTDIAAAWEVIERIKQLGWVARIGQFDTTDRWNCRFVPIVQAAEWEFATEDTASLAICLAALKALSLS